MFKNEYSQDFNTQLELHFNHSVNGDYNQAIKHGRQLVSLAKNSGDVEQMVIAVTALGKSFIMADKLKKSLLELNSAWELIQQNPHIDYTVQAELTRTRASALHLLRDFDGAKNAYLDTIFLLEKLYGEEHIKLAEIYGELASLCFQANEMSQYWTINDKRIEILRSYTRLETPEDEGWLDNVSELIKLLINRIANEVSQGGREVAIVTYRELMDLIIEYKNTGEPIHDEIIDHLDILVYTIKLDADDQMTEEIDQMEQNWYNFLDFGDNKIRQEKIFWHGLKRITKFLLQTEVDEQTIIEAIDSTAKGSTPEIFSFDPNSENFPAEFDQRFKIFPKLIVFFPMALELAGEKGVTPTLDDLEELCISYILEEEGCV